MISQRILPPVVVVVPIYVMFQQLGLLDTSTALIITYIAVNLPIVVWLMRDFFPGIPLELEEMRRDRRRLALPDLLLDRPAARRPGPGRDLHAGADHGLERVPAGALPLQRQRPDHAALVAAQNATRGPQWWYMSVLIIVMIVPVIVMAIALERLIARGLLVGAVKG